MIPSDINLKILSDSLPYDFILIDKFPNKTYICESGKISEIDIKNKNINSIYK